MICCGQCGEWYHGECVGVSQQNAADLGDEIPYICQMCKNTGKIYVYLVF